MATSLYRFTAFDPVKHVSYQNTVPADSFSEAIALLERNAVITTGLPLAYWVVQRVDPNN